MILRGTPCDPGFVDFKAYLCTFCGNFPIMELKPAGTTARTLGLSEQLTCRCGVSIVPPGVPLPEDVIEAFTAPDNMGRTKFCWTWADADRRIHGQYFFADLGSYVNRERARPLRVIARFPLSSTLDNQPEPL